MEKCAYVFKRGSNKGKECGLKTFNSTCFCRTHDGKVLELGKLPTLAMDKIIDTMILTNSLNETRNIFQKLVAISNSCKEYKNLIGEDKWKMLYEHITNWHHFVNVKDRCCKEYDLMLFRNRLHLLLDVGCQRCGASNITKIYWPFPIRVCVYCFEKITVRDYELESQYRINNYTSNYYIQGTSWSRHGGTSQFRYYWKYLIVQDLGCSLIEHKLRKLQKSIQHKMEIAESLGVHLDDLSNHLGTADLMATDYPNKSMVHQLYYRHTALAILKTFFIKYEIKTNTYTIIQKQCNMIQTKEDYDIFFQNMETNKDEILSKTDDEAFHALLSVTKNNIISSLHAHPYFSDMSIEQLTIYLPETQTLSGLNYEDLRTTIKKYNTSLDCFINKNNVTFDDIHNVQVQSILKKTIKFPQTEPSNIKQFLLSIFNYIADIDKISSWKEACVFINSCRNIFERKVCNICRGKRDYCARGLNDHFRSVHNSLWLANKKDFLF